MNDAEPNTPSNETLEQSADLAEKIVAKLTGAKPFESDCAMVDARINESSCNSQLLRPSNASNDAAVEPNIPTSKSPTFTSGGGGIDYEDYVVAYYLAMMLLQRMPLGSNFGTIERVLWQAEDTNWLFDDVVVCNASGQEAGISAKTDVHLNSNGFSDDFARRAWSQFRSESGRTFADGDLICIALRTISTDVLRAWRLLANQLLVADLSRLVTRLETDDDAKNPQSSSMQRKWVQSLIDRCARTPVPTSLEALQLLQNVRVLPFDFVPSPSSNEDAVIQSLQYAVEGGEREDATTLWKELLNISKSMRSGGGDIGRNELVARILQSKIQLRSLPNHETHLEKWRQQTDTRLHSAAWGIKGNVNPLDRVELWESLSELDGQGRPLVFVGASGSGKTSLASETAIREHRRRYLLDETLCSQGGLIPGGLFAGTSYSISDLLKSENQQCLLLIDSCEKLEDEVLQNLLSYITELNSTDESNRLKIIFTCIPNQSDRILVALNRFGIESNTLAIPNPLPNEVAQLIGDDTSSFKVENKPQLLDVLTNLKVLELFVRAKEAGIALNAAGDMSPSKVFDFLWNDWINRSKSNPERGRLLQRIALESSKRLVQTLPILELESHESTLLVGLANDGLINSDEVVFFTHDFVRDLSRSRILLGDSIDEIVTKSTDYPWHGAIRLYAQRLAECDFSDWLEQLQSVSRETDGWHICHSVFMEGLVQAAEANPALVGNIWNDCGSGDLQMVLRKKFLECVIDAAPIDEQWSVRDSQGLLASAGPWRKYDSVVIQELLKMANGNVPDHVEPRRLLVLICEMTFRRKLAGEELPANHISNITNVALEVAGTLVSGKRNYRLDDVFRKSVYRCLLLSVLGNPDRAIDLIILAAERRPRGVVESETQESKPLLEAAQRIGVAPILSEESGERKLEPWPSGPLDRVDDDFRKVCLESDLLLPLTIVAPEKVKEVLFACAIEPPQSRGRRGFSSEPDIGLVDYHTRTDPLYDVGPFLNFFRVNPGQALDYLISITNFAAVNWSKSQHRIDLDTRAFDNWGKRLGPFEFEVARNSLGETATWYGNGNIYCWSVGGLPINKTITCALMAFEYWAYESLEAGKDIALLLKQAVSESRNAGMAGCLIDIGKKHPKLFTGPLRDLLGCWAFYAWDAAKVFQNSSMPPLMLGRAMTSSPQRVKLASDWLRQPHRKTDLIRLAAMLLVRNEPFREFIEGCRQRWDNEDSERFSVHQMKHLLSVFNWSNYRAEDQGNGSLLVSYHPPDEILKDAVAINEELETKQLLLTFPFQCRQTIKLGKQLDTQQFQHIWNSVQKVNELPVSDEEDADPMKDPVVRRVNCVSAGVATLLTLGKEHLTSESSLFCRNHFESLIANPPRTRGFDMPESPAEHSWDYSLADMTIAYLAEDENDEAARWGVDRCLTAFHYHSLEHFMNLARNSRIKFPKLFNLLPQYVRSYAALREKIHRVESELNRAETRFQRWQEIDGNGEYESASRLESLRDAHNSLMKSFEQFDGMVVNWDEVDVTWQNLVENSVSELKEASEILDLKLLFRNHDDNARSLGHVDVGLDLHVVEHGFNWIDLSVAANETEFLLWSSELRGLVSLRRMLVPELLNNQEFRNWDHGHKFDTFVMNLVCRNVVGSIGRDTSECWKPMLDEISFVPKFVDDFLRNFNCRVYDAKLPPTEFVSLWSAMVEHALASKEWTDTDSCAEQWKSLLGMSFSAQLHSPEIDPVWSNSVSQELSFRRLVFVKAIGVAIQSSSICASLIEHFQQPLWRSLRLDILELLNSSPLFTRDDTDFPSDKLTDFLTICWSDHSRQIIKQARIEQAFQSLLSRSIRAGSTAAKELAQSVGLIERTKA